MTIKRMSADLQIPAADAPAEEWGRLAVAIPRLQWMPGMRDGETGNVYMGHCWCDGWTAWEAGDDMDGAWPDPDDPSGATGGCLLRLLGMDPARGHVSQVLPPRYDGDPWGIYVRLATGDVRAKGYALGRACIAAAAAIGEWPGGAL